MKEKETGLSERLKRDLPRNEAENGSESAEAAPLSVREEQTKRTSRK